MRLLLSYLLLAGASASHNSTSTTTTNTQVLSTPNVRILRPLPITIVNNNADVLDSNVINDGHNPTHIDYDPDHGAFVHNGGGRKVYNPK